MRLCSSRVTAALDFPKSRIKPPVFTPSHPQSLSLSLSSGAATFLIRSLRATCGGVLMDILICTGALDTYWAAWEGTNGMAVPDWNPSSLVMKYDQH